MSNGVNSTQFNDEQGWSNGPDTRGSLDIIVACLTTFVLCTWSCICCNVPAPGDSQVRQIFRKASLTVISLLGPELLLYIAVGQWLSARESVKSFHKLGYLQWTLRHAFYADMGGFRVKLIDEEEFPLDTKSLLWLVRQGILTERDVNETVIVKPEFINDRDKADALIRIITIIQTLWFTFNVILRLCYHYPTTVLEITILGYLVPSMVNFWVWWHKPRDVETAIRIVVPVKLQQIFDMAGHGSDTWHRTPFDFIEREEFHGSILYHYWITILERLLRRHPKPGPKRPRQYRSDHNILVLKEPFKFGYVEVLPAFFYIGAPFIAWYQHFPTAIEQTLWRISCIGMASPYVLGAMYEVLLLRFRPSSIEREKLGDYRMRSLELRQELSLRGQSRGTSPLWKLRARFQLFCHSLRNNSFDDDPNLDVPLRMLIPATIGAAIYALSRLYMVIEDAIGLRAVPSGVYDKIPWMPI